MRLFYKTIGWGLICASFLTACAFEKDEDYYIQKRDAFFLSTDGKLFIQNFNQLKPFLPDKNIQDIEIIKTTLYCAGKQGFEYNLRKSSLIKEYNFESQCVAVGDRYAIWGDTTGRALYWTEKDGDAAPFRIAVAEPPQAICFNAGRFYVQTGLYNLSIFEETSGALRQTLRFQNPIRQLGFSRYFNVCVLTQKSGENRFFESIIDVNGDLISQNEKEVPFTAKLYSPYLRKQFETEWLADVSRAKNGRLDVAAVKDSVRTFFCDFRNADLYFSKQDSFISFHLYSLKRTAIQTQDSFLKARFYYDELHNL